MKPVKVSDLSGPALDWAVAKCEGLIIKRFVSGRFYVKGDNGAFCYAIGGSYSPSSDWYLAGPIIERVGIDIRHRQEASCHYEVLAEIRECRDMSGKRLAWAMALHHEGPVKELIAIMRCYVSSKLGDTIEIPEELI